MDDKPKLAAVLPMRDNNLRDIPTNLRKLADAIEAKEYGDVTQCALVLFGAGTSVFAFGNCDLSQAHLLLAMGQRTVEDSVLFADDED